MPLMNRVGLFFFFFRREEYQILYMTFQLNYKISIILKKTYSYQLSYQGSPKTRHSCTNSNWGTCFPLTLHFNFHQMFLSSYPFRESLDFFVNNNDNNSLYLTLSGYVKCIDCIYRSFPLTYPFSFSCSSISKVIFCV